MSFAVAFFVGATIVTLAIGVRFTQTADPGVTYFGWGLVGIGVAFGFWSVGRIIDPSDPDDLEIWTSIGVFFLLVGLVLLFWAWVGRIDRHVRSLVLLGGFALLTALIVLRFIYPSEPFIDEDGVLFFNPHGSVAALEVGALTAAALPAIFEISRRFRARDALVAKVGLTTAMTCGIVLVVSVDKVLIAITSIVMAAVLIVLAVAFLARPQASWLQGASETPEASSS